jgi:gluconolactonase
MFADIPSSSIRKWTPGGGVSVFMQPSGYKGSVPYGGPEPGSNGMTLDRAGRLTVAGHARQNVWRLERIDSKATDYSLADSYQPLVNLVGGRLLELFYLIFLTRECRLS